MFKYSVHLFFKYFSKDVGAILLVSKFSFCSSLKVGGTCSKVLCSFQNWQKEVLVNRLLSLFLLVKTRSAESIFTQPMLASQIRGGIIVGFSL